MKYDEPMRYDFSAIELHLNTFVDSLRVAFVPIQTTWLLLPVFTSRALVLGHQNPEDLEGFNRCVSQMS